MRLLLSCLSCVIISFLLLPDIIAAQNLTLYSGRSKALVEPVVDRFEEQTGINVQVRYGSSTQLSLALMEEGSRTPADLFWAQDAGALGAVHAEGILEELPNDLLAKVPEQFRSKYGTWVGTSGRARVIAFSTSRTEKNELPGGIQELTDEKWAGRVGWAPANASFQAFLTAFRASEGEDTARQWLEAMKDNRAQNYTNNNALIQAISAGEIDLAITNHYYLFRYLDSNPDYPVDQTYFDEGDPGNFINVAGIGVISDSRNKEAAVEFTSFLLQESSQNYFIDEIFEYPVINGLEFNPDETTIEDIRENTLRLDLDELEDLDATLTLLREVGLL